MLQCILTQVNNTTEAASQNSRDHKVHDAVGCRIPKPPHHTWYQSRHVENDLEDVDETLRFAFPISKIYENEKLS